MTILFKTNQKASIKVKERPQTMISMAYESNLTSSLISNGTSVPEACYRHLYSTEGAKKEKQTHTQLRCATETGGVHVPFPAFAYQWFFLFPPFFSWASFPFLSHFWILQQASKANISVLSDWLRNISYIEACGTHCVL